VSEQLALLPDYLGAHLQLTLLALAAGIAVSVPLGVLVTRVSWLETPVLGVVSVIQTIPSLALLAVLVPLLAAMGARSIGFLPAFIGLVLYSMLPVLRNTAVGIRGVDPALREAADGVGMTPRQRLLRVELPVALPVIIAGVRTAAVWTVGMATLSTPVGAASLGNYIFGGLQTRNLDAILVGCVAAAGLALLLDGLVHLLAIGVARRRRALTAVAAAGLLGLTGYAGAGMVRDTVRGRADVVIGAKTFTEQYILADLLAGRIHRTTGLRTSTLQSLGSTVAFDALRNGDIDLYVDYSGTIWATIMKRDGAGGGRDQVLAEVGGYLADHDHITLIGSLGFENAYALAMRRGDAERLGVRRISDLVPHAAALTIGGDYEFFSRPEWAAIRDRYHLEFAGQRSMDPSLMYQAAAQGEVDVISAFSTDGRIDAFDLVVLEDDRGAIPPYDAIVLAGSRMTRRHPEAIEALRGLIGRIDAAAMRRMNLAVDRGGDSPATVASQFLDRLDGAGAAR